MITLRLRFGHGGPEIVVTFGDVLFSRFRWWRKHRGGHWERWYIDHPVCSSVWLHVDRCTERSGNRPDGLCRGTPECEQHDDEFLTPRFGW